MDRREAQLTYFPWNTNPWPYEQLRVSAVRASDVSAELISLDAAKLFLRVSTNADDELISSLIKAAREYAEKRTGRSLVRKDYILSLNRFPNMYMDCTTAIELQFPPLVQCDTIKYIGTDGVEHPLSSGIDFQVDFSSEPGRVCPTATNLFWPATMYGVMNAVRVFYSAGYEPQSSLSLDQNNAVDEPELEQVTIPSVTNQVTDWTIDRTIPNDLLTAVKQLVVHWYQNRDVVIAMPGAGGVYAPLPIHLDEIINQHRLMNLALTFPQHSQY